MAKFEVLDGAGDVENVIIADPSFMQMIYPSGNYREVSESSPTQQRIFYSELDFLRRFTQQSRVSVLAAANTDVVIADFMLLLRAAGGCYLDDPDTVAGIGYLVQSNLITQGEADSILGG